MSVKKRKHKVVKHNSHTKKNSGSSAFLNRHPRLFLASGVLLLLLGVLLLSIGYVDTAKIGIAMIAFFFGISLVLFASSVSPKN